MTGPRAITVVARSHTGSTMLQLLLAGRPGVIAVGELESVLRRVAVDRAAVDRLPCGCGCAAGDCPLWSAVLDDPGPDVASLAARLATRAEALLGAPPVLVDASKSVVVARALRSGIGEVTVVRLVRDVRADVAGRLRRAPRARKGQSGVRAALRERRAASASLQFRDWYRDNRWFDAALADDGFEVVTVSYEHLTAAPAVEVPALVERLGLGEPGRVDLDATGSHVLFGNRMRLDPALSSAVRADVRWLHERRWQLPALLMPHVMRYNSELAARGTAAAWPRPPGGAHGVQEDEDEVVPT